MNTAFGPLVTAMVTPFTPDLAVDYQRAAELAARLVRQGSTALVVSGTTGESPTLTTEEKLRLFRTVKQAVPVPVIAGTGSNSTRASVELSRQAAEAGVDALLLVAPYYNKPPQEGLYRHFKAVAEATPLPVMVYNIPGRTGVEIAPETLERLADIPNVVAVKEALPNLDAVSDLLARLARRPVAAGGAGAAEGPALAVYSGEDSLTLPMMALGGAGVVSVASHLAGPQMRQMMDDYTAGRVTAAARMHHRLFPLFKGLFLTTNPIMVKAALKLVGFPVGGLRPPLVEATLQQEEAMRQILEQVGLPAG